MTEFLKEYSADISHGVELCAAIAGLLSYKKYRHTNAVYFIWFLVYIVCMETISLYPLYIHRWEWLSAFKKLTEGTIFASNYWFFTIFWCIGSTLFYLFYFRKIVTNSNVKKILKYAMVFFFVGSIIYISYDWTILYLLTPISIYIAGVFSVILAIVLYLLELLQSDKILNLHKSLNFYVAIAVLVWHVITTPMVFFGVYYSESDWDFMLLRWQIYLIVNVFMYLTFTFALLWCNPKNT